MATFRVGIGSRNTFVNALDVNQAKLIGTAFLVFQFPDLATGHGHAKEIVVETATYDQVKAHETFGRGKILTEESVTLMSKHLQDSSTNAEGEKTTSVFLSSLYRS